jgi:hypothetical protein
VKLSLTLYSQVTTDPASKIPINEGVGTVTSDSLAGESLKNSGSFGEGNPKAAASKQPSSSTTTNTTDTTNATKLDAAVNAEARDAQEGWNEEKIMSSGKGLSGASSGGAAGTAPTGLAAGKNVDPSVLQPKGANLTEDPNMSLLGKQSSTSPRGLQLVLGLKTRTWPRAATASSAPWETLPLERWISHSDEFIID